MYVHTHCIVFCYIYRIYRTRVCVYMIHTHICTYTYALLKLLVSFAKEPYKRDDILQKRPALPYMCTCMVCCLSSRIVMWVCCIYIHIIHVHEHMTCHTLQHTATHCNTLQHTTTHCNTLQHTATHCMYIHIIHVHLCIYIHM